MNIERNKVIERTGLKPIVYDTYHLKNSQQKPVVVFCHGYKGFKDWGAWHLVAKAFANAGFFFLKFNFSHNGGTVEDPIDFPDLDAFAENNYSKELEDLDTVLETVVNTSFFSSEVDSDNISLLGHSRGGGIVLIKAEEDPRVKNVITWAGVCDFKVRFFEGSEAFEKWSVDGVTYVENGRTRQQMPHHWQFYEDFLANEERLTIKRAVKGLEIPQLIVHGDADPTVTIKEAQALHSWNPKSKLMVFPNADHVFGAQHPWHDDRLPNDLDQIVRQSIAFLEDPKKV